MERRIAFVTLFALALLGVFASVALASSSSTGKIIKDASDGVISGHYTAAQVRAALAAVNGDPVYSQYSDISGVIQAYLSGSNYGGSDAAGAAQIASSTGASKPTTTEGGQLDYTGGQPFLVFALGGALVVAGLSLLRHRV
jgi:hypothetical protein